MNSQLARVVVDSVAGGLAIGIRAESLKMDRVLDPTKTYPGWEELLTIADAMVGDCLPLPARANCRVVFDDNGSVVKFVNVAPVVDEVHRCRVMFWGVNRQWISCQIPSWRGKKRWQIQRSYPGFYRIYPWVWQQSQADISPPWTLFANLNLNARRVRELRISLV